MEQLPYEIMELIILNNLDYSSYYNLLLTNTYFANTFMKNEFIKKLKIQMYLKNNLNYNYSKFKYYIQYSDEATLQYIFNLAISKYMYFWNTDIHTLYDLRYVF